MRHFGVTGYPLGHSFSASYFAGKFQSENIGDAAFFNFPVKRASSVRELFVKDQMLIGLSVTLPYKRSVIPFLDSIDHEVENIGAVNSIRAVRSDGSLHLRGFNTDHYGFSRSLTEREGFKRGGRAIILGAGGAAAAVRYALEYLDFDILRVSRKRYTGSVLYEDITASDIGSADIIVNATPLGMYPETDASPPIDYGCARPDTLFYDLVYNPPVTRFMEEGAARGADTMNGSRMLVLQAERSWEIWNYLDKVV